MKKDDDIVKEPQSRNKSFLFSKVVNHFKIQDQDVIFPVQTTMLMMTIILTIMTIILMMIIMRRRITLVANMPISLSIAVGGGGNA